MRSKSSKNVISGEVGKAATVTTYKTTSLGIDKRAMRIRGGLVLIRKGENSEGDM